MLSKTCIHTILSQRCASTSSPPPAGHSGGQVDRICHHATSPAGKYGETGQVLWTVPLHEVQLGRTGGPPCPGCVEREKE